MSNLRTFKAQKGKVLYCASGDIIFNDGFYATDKQDEIESILKGQGIEEVTGTDEAKDKPTGKKRSTIAPKKDEKKDKEVKTETAEEKKEKEDAKQAEFQKHLHGFETPKDLVAQVLDDIVKCETLEGVDGLNAYNAENKAFKKAIKTRREELEEEEIKNQQQTPQTPQDGDVALEDMPVEDMKKYLDHRKVGYADDIAEDDLRNLVKTEAQNELHKANGGSDVEPLSDNEDIEVMPKPRCQELLKKAGVGFKSSDGVAKLRPLVAKLK